MNCLTAYCFLPWQPISTRVNYKSFSNRFYGIDFSTMLSYKFNFKITSDSFNLRWQLFVAFPIKGNTEESFG